ncbi:hypothetical protein [Aliarcobacter cibarius]|uniref:Uncharacterized protein n=1 Tax=Aliarcobacter cibarius TaxID=255507 RepID=A0A5J6RHD7_9BACT|nr:hypothetical protein [Aliarcobacter cibarius]QEZ89486.1 hypothetical protein ACIB15232_1385 [Aliarcobacter cibarius]QKJ27487.1 hypothetical protein ACBT_1587 [Aliarcobacter cibarius]TLS99265.1 hypothetical protein FE247_06020 [Aliarcobacter cibarius]TLT00408.1 hypothetical protein FE245_05170 [Aliarcobacter cibarius]TLT04376.1 hypothetical protein FE248_04260 [Aliarcobacter cibarius]
MRQILVLLFVVFAFLGCNQKQVVQLKMPGQKAPVVKQSTPKMEEDKVTVVEEFTPVEIMETDIKEQIINNNGSSNEVLEPNEKFSNIDTTKANVNLAFVYPASLSKYAKSSINTVAGYLAFKNLEYNLTVIETSNENFDTIQNAFSNIRDKNINKVIALFSPNAINSLSKVVNSDFKVYLPLIEKKDSLENNDNLIFGSISYEEQLKKLSYYSNGNNILFYQDTYLSRNIKKAYNNVVSSGIEREIKNSEKNFKGVVGGLNASSLYLNLDIVKSALVLSQLRASDVSPAFIFGTQAIYDLNLLTLTQDEDRKKLIVANSIGEVDKKLKDEINSMGADLNFSWVDYSTLVGVNYLVDGNSNLIPTKIENNEAIYMPRLYKSTSFGFVEIK